MSSSGEELQPKKSVKSIDDVLNGLRDIFAKNSNATYADELTNFISEIESIKNSKLLIDKMTCLRGILEQLQEGINKKNRIQIQMNWLELFFKEAEFETFKILAYKIISKINESNKVVINRALERRLFIRSKDDLLNVIELNNIYLNPFDMEYPAKLKLDRTKNQIYSPPSFADLSFIATADEMAIWVWNMTAGELLEWNERHSENELFYSYKNAGARKKAIGNFLIELKDNIQINFNNPASLSDQLLINLKSLKKTLNEEFNITGSKTLKKVEAILKVVERQIVLFNVLKRQEAKTENKHQDQTKFCKSLSAAQKNAANDFADYIAMRREEGKSFFRDRKEPKIAAAEKCIQIVCGINVELSEEDLQSLSAGRLKNILMKQETAKGGNILVDRISNTEHQKNLNSVREHHERIDKRIFLLKK